MSAKYSYPKSYSKSKKRYDDKVWRLAKEISLIIQDVIENDAFHGIDIRIKDDGKGEIEKILKEMSKEYTDVPIWDKDECIKFDYTYNQIDNVWVAKIWIAPITHCDPNVLIREYKKLQEKVEKLLKEELWIKEKPQDGGDSQ